MSADPSAMFSLKDRVVVVTGGSRGLGRRIALACSRAGAHVVIASRDGDRCAETAAEISAETGGITMPYGLHVGRWNAIEPFVDAVYERFGRVDVLVNNAGSSPVYDSLAGVSEALFDAIFAVNARGPFRLCALVGERMAAAGRGSIVNISSMGSLRPTPGALPYAAAKAALNTMTVGFAHAYGPEVRVNGILPGFVETDIAAAWDRDAIAEKTARFALRRTAHPDELVGTVLYLASDASSYTTGATIRVDGGIP